MLQEVSLCHIASIIQIGNDSDQIHNSPALGTHWLMHGHCYANVHITAVIYIHGRE